MTREERNAMILVLVKTRSYSYGVIGRMMHVTRNVVAGVVFRDRYPAAVRMAGPDPIAEHDRQRTEAGQLPSEGHKEQSAQG